MMADNQLTPAEERQGWKLLFDGSSFAGWTFPYEDHGWTIDNGAICCAEPVGGGRNVCTAAKYEDFELYLEYLHEENVNSGIFLRQSDLYDPVHTGLEVQILDNYGDVELNSHTCGAIYDLVAPKSAPFKPAGQWNTVRITCRGPEISVSLNGEQVSEMDVSRWTEPGRNPDGTENKFRYAWADLPRLGHIGLQDHSGRIWFKNIKLKPE